jgi:hypothetical protein
MSQVQKDAQAAYELLSDKNKWTTDHYARDAAGRPAQPYAQGAVCWCAIGAAERVTRDVQRADRLIDTLGVMLGVTKRRSLAELNDGPDGYEKILAAYKAIAEGP